MNSRGHRAIAQQVVPRIRMLVMMIRGLMLRMTAMMTVVVMVKMVAVMLMATGMLLQCG